MIIKLIPETDSEKQNMKEEVYEGVLEYFVFGVRADEDGHTTDFHSWRGNHRYLQGSLNYFYETINTHRNFDETKELEKKSQFKLNPGQIEELVRRGKLMSPPVQQDEFVNQDDVAEDAAVEDGENVENIPPAGWELKK